MHKHFYSANHHLPNASACKRLLILCLFFLPFSQTFAHTIELKTIEEGTGPENTTRFVLEGYFNRTEIITGGNLFLGQSWGYLEVKINGRKVFTEGNITPFYYTGSKVITIQLPEEVLKPYLNKITLTVIQDSSFIKLPEPRFISILNANYYENIINFINIDLNIILVVIYLLFGTFLIIYRKSLLSAPSLIYLGWGFIASSFYFLRTSIAMVPSHASMTYSKGLIVAGLGLIFIFFLKYYKVKNQNLFFAPTIALIAFSIVYLAGSSNFHEMSMRFSSCLFIIIALLSGSLIVVLLNLSPKKPEGYFFLVALVLASGISVLDIIEQFNMFHTHILRQGIGFFVFAVCIAMGIIYKNLRAFDILNAPSQSPHDSSQMSIKEVEGELIKIKEQIKNEESAIPEVLHQITDDIDEHLNFVLKAKNQDTTAATENMVIAKGRQLIAKANRTMDFARFNSQNLKLNYKTINFAYLSEDIREKSNRLPGRCRFEFDNAIPERITTDQNRFMQIINHYLKLYKSEQTELYMTVKNISQNKNSCLLLFEMSNPTMQVGEPEEREQKSDAAIVHYLIKMLGGSTTVSKQHVQCSFSLRVEIPSSELIQKPNLTYPDDNLVLLISDSASFISRFQKHILESGLRIDSTNNENVAIDLLSEKQYSIIFIDEVLNSKSQGELIEPIRNAGYDKNIIAFCENCNCNEIRYLNESGFDGVMSKEISRHHLFKNIDFLIGELGLNPPIKLKRIEELVEGDEKAIQMVVQGFFTQYAKNIETMRTAVSEKVMDVLLREAHALKGAAGNLGSGVILQVSHEIELAVRNKEHSPIPFMIEFLANYYQKLMNYALLNDLILPDEQLQSHGH